jgi:hypothetical protein
MFSQLAEIFSLIFNQPVLFVGIPLVSLLPYFSTFLYTEKYGYVTALIQLSTLIFFPASMGATAKAVIDIQNNGLAAFGNCLKTGFSKSAIFLILIPIILLLLFLISMIFSLIVGILQIFHTPIIIVILIALILLSVISALYFAVIPVIVLEQSASLQSFKRSVELSRGNVPTIALFLLVLFALTTLIFSYLFYQLTFGKNPFIGFNALFTEFNIKLAGLYLFFSTILFTACGVFYKNCYKLTESKKVEDLANIF